MDVFGNIRDEEGQDQLEGQQRVLGTNIKNQHVSGATVVYGLVFGTLITTIRLQDEGMLLLAGHNMVRSSVHINIFEALSACR